MTDNIKNRNNNKHQKNNSRNINNKFHNPNQFGYHNPNQIGYHNPNQFGYHNPNQFGYHNPNQFGYHNPNQFGYHPNQFGYHPNQFGYHPNQFGYHNPNQFGDHNQLDIHNGVSQEQMKSNILLSDIKHNKTEISNCVSICNSCKISPIKGPLYTHPGMSNVFLCKDCWLKSNDKNNLNENKYKHFNNKDSAIVFEINSNNVDEENKFLETFFDKILNKNKG